MCRDISAPARSASWRSTASAVREMAARRKWIHYPAMEKSSARGTAGRDAPRVRVMHRGAPAWGSLEGDVIVLDDGTRIADAEAHYLAPARPSKILAVHLTYRSRVEEYAARIPPQPSYFMKPPTTLNGHRGVVRRPAGTRFLNYEGELAVVIGQRMHGVSEVEALDYVAGYTCANDVGLHDFRHADRGSMLRVKGQDGFLPLGPGLVRDFDPTDFHIRTILNGEVVQKAHASDLLFSVAYQLADLSRLITLEPGDVVLTGTPANSRPMEPGDTVEVEIEGIGRLTNTIEEWDVDLSGVGEQPATSAQTLHVALAIPEDEAERMVDERSTR
jgi:5-oxopent-3-ene-1,2,5-tricarboxylate decarboxylase/2-hydroxyhepta-2,4-diene-1,7-dioate isomerase